MRSTQTRSAKHGKAARRTRGRGNYRQVSPTSFEVYYYRDGKRRQEYVGSPEEAERRLDEIQRAKREGRDELLDDLTFDQLCEQFMTDKRGQGLKPSTLRGYRDIIDLHLIPALGSARVRTFKHRHITSYRTAKLRGAHDAELPVAGKAQAKLAAHSVRNHIELLNGIFKFALLNGHIATNPVEGVGRPTGGAENVEAFETEHALDIIELLPPDSQMLGELLLATGLRIGEALSLRHADLRPYRNGWGIFVSRTMTRDGSRDVEGDSGKTRNAYRYLACSGGLRAVLEDYMRHTAHYPDPDGNPFLFRSPQTGGSISASNFRNRYWLPAVGTVELRRIHHSKLDALLAILPANRAALVATLAEAPGLSLDAARYLPMDAYDRETGRLTYPHITDGPTSLTLSAALRARLDANLNAIAARGPRFGKLGLLFPGKTGQPFSTTSMVNIVFRDGFKACDIRPMTRIHNLRHTYATTLIEDSLIDDSQLAYRMGHSSPSFTRSQYGHVRDRVKQTPADIYAITRRHSEGAA